MVTEYKENSANLYAGINIILPCSEATFLNFQIFGIHSCPKTIFLSWIANSNGPQSKAKGGISYQQIL